MNKDIQLQGNEKIEEAIVALQNNATEELLAHTLTVIRRRMNEGGHFIIAVDSNENVNDLKIGTIQTAEGKLWFVAFTSFEEEIKGSNQVMSAFTSTISQIFETVLESNEVSGLIVNPWDKTIMLDKNLIKIIIGKTNY